MTFLLGKWLLGMKPKAAPGVRTRRGAKRFRPHWIAPRLEALEDRTVPTVLFAPQFGNESFLRDGGQRISSPDVYVVLWGSSWGGLSSPAANQVLAGTSGVLSSHYLDGLAQYGVTTSAHYKGIFFDNRPDPPSGFSQQMLKSEINLLILTGQLPNPFTNPNMIVDMVTTSNISSDLPNAAGYNSAGRLGGLLGGNAGYIWNGTKFGSLSMQDACSLIFSHELAETMTDPGGKGYEVNKGTSWPGTISNANQIGDYEGNNYGYRMSNAALVQPYWSNGNGGQFPTGWLITDGNAQTLNVKANWTKPTNGSMPQFINYDVTVNGGQVATPNGDRLVIGKDTFGLWVTLNNEAFQFDSTTLNTLTANVTSGLCNISDSPTMAGITVNGRSSTEVRTNTTNAPLTINGVGTVTVGAGLLKNVHQKVTVSGGNRTNLTINDASTTDPGANYSVSNVNFSANRSGLLVSIDYSNLRSLTVNGGTGGTYFQVFSTPNVATTLNTGSGADAVYVYGTSAALSVNGQGGDDNVHIGVGGTTRLIGGAVSVTNSNVSYTSVDVDDRNDKFARTVIVYGKDILGLPTTIISGLTPGGDISLRSARVNYLTIHAGSGGNTFRIHDTPFSSAPGGAKTILVTGAGNDNVTVDGTSGPLTVDGGGGLDTVKIGTGSLQNFGSSVTVANTGGYSAVTVDDSADSSQARTVIMYNNGPPGGFYTVISGFYSGGDILVHGSDLSSLTIRAGNFGNTFRIHDTPISNTPGGLTTKVFTGGGPDNVTIDGTTGALVLDVQGAAQGLNSVTVGSPIVGLNNIRGPVTLTGQGGSDQLTFNDRGTTTLQNYTLTANQLTRLDGNSVANMAPISFAGFPAIALNVSTGGSTTSVIGSAAGSTVIVNGNLGSQDQFAVDASQNAILGPVIFHGQSTDADFAQYLDLNNSVSHTYTLTATSVTREDQAPVNFDGLFAMILYAPMVGGNTVNVNSEAAGAAYKIIAANGDHVTIGSQAPNLGGTLANILDQVNIVSYTANDAVSLVVDDSGNADTTATKHITFDKDSEGNTNMVGLIPSPISWLLPSASSVTVRGGAANEIFSMQPFVATTPLTIVGGTGSNTLDYSAYTTDVTVNLQTGTATDLAGIKDPNTGRVTIQNVIGGSSNDTLIAGAARSILIGGGGADHLFGGSGEDILIGGTTDYTQPGNLNAAALDAILQEWNRTDLGFDDRMSDLFTGSNALGVPAKNVIGATPILLNSTTVHDDLAADVLTGGTGPDWYFIGINDLISNKKPGDAVTMV
jgi:hypothetical protein